MIRPSILEVLESRIAPALVVVNPIADIVVGAGNAGDTLELSQMLDPLVGHPGHTIVTFTLNYDANPATPAIEPTQIKMELFDDEAPLTVQNFLRYVEGGDAAEFVNTFFHRSVSNFVLQGGGFSASSLKHLDEHIDTFSTVHNEFSADRSNLRGTIAMAKVATNENTASSEWFVNLADNSSNLDNQNGGFTVFGRVIEGMDVIDKIAALPKANFGGALGAVPVQKMNVDPDNNPNTLSPKPGKDNLITVTGVQIDPAEVGNVQGITYSVQVLDGGNKNVLKTSSVTGTKLNLAYDPTQNGVATVQVTATDTDTQETATDTFTVTLRPNLIGSVTSDSLASILLPGEGGKLKFAVKNNGGANFSGMASITFWMSSRDGQNGDDPEGAILDTEDDLQIGDTLNQLITINADGTLNLTADPKLTSELLKVAIDDYRLLVQIKPADGTTQELFTDDNVAIDGGVHVLTNQFGTIDLSSAGLGKRTNAKLTYFQPGTTNLVTLSLKGPGTGQVTLDEGLLPDTTDDRAELLFTKTTMSSLAKIASGTANFHPAFSQIDATDAIGKLSFDMVDQPGDVALSSGAKTVTFGNVNLGSLPGESRLTIGSPLVPRPVSIRLGQVEDLSIDCSQPISSLIAIEWKDVTTPSDVPAGADDSIIAASISSLKIMGSKDGSIRGDFEANVETFSSAKLSNISIAGLVNNATIHTRGDIGKVTVGGLISSDIFAGTDARPDALTDFDTTRTIQSLTIKELSGVTTQFFDSQVAASIIHTVALRGVDGTSGDGPFGIVADEVGKYSRDGAHKLSKLGDPAILDKVGNYELLIL
jgi:peptidyl-prolyl cis-trans isomerase A (cyclophilin A)